MSRQLISYDDLAPVSSASSSGAEAGPSSVRLPSVKAVSNDPTTSSPASATGEKMTYSQRKRLKRKQKEDARSRELNYQSKQSPQANKKAKHGHQQAQSSVEAESLLQASVSSDLDEAIPPAENGAGLGEAAETYDEYGYYDEKGHYFYDEEGNSFYFDPHAEDDEEDDDDEDLMLTTNIMIPDIPEHLRSAVHGQDHQQINDIDSYEEEMDDDEAYGRVLEAEEIWSDEALTSAWTAARESLLGTYGLSAPGTHSALWYEAPTPGSVAARKAKRESDMNLERRKLLAWQEEKRKKEEAARRAEDEEDQARNEAKAGVGIVQTNGFNAQQGAMNPPTAASTSDAANVSRVSPVRSRLGGRSIPPSIGLPGNQAWRDACKTVAATRNQVGPEVSLSASNTSKVNGTAHQQPQETISTAGATSMAAPPVAGSSLPLPTPAAAPNAIPSIGNPQQDEVLQNIANAWYHAGYYTAQWHWMTSAGRQ